jgi:hypothetical protein
VGLSPGCRDAAKTQDARVDRQRRRKDGPPSHQPIEHTVRERSSILFLPTLRHNPQLWTPSMPTIALAGRLHYPEESSCYSSRYVAQHTTSCAQRLQTWHSRHDTESTWPFSSLPRGFTTEQPNGFRYNPVHPTTPPRKWPPTSPP